MFMTGESLVEWLSIREAAEMERLAPSIFIEICGEVIVSEVPR
jgi:hypothetical protein